jgi:uroporphyrinogen-III synthase
MSLPLTGRTIALAEGRQLEELAQMLEKEGATILRCPMLSILDAPDPVPVVAWIRDLIAGRFGLVVFLTGEGIRRLLGFAERAGIHQDLVTAMGRTQTLTRGPKPARALKEIGLAPTFAADQPTTDGVIDKLRDKDLVDQVVGVQLYSDANPPLVEFLEGAGATVSTVQPYVYAPKADGSLVVELIEKMARGEVDSVVFTSSPQVDRLHEIAAENSIEPTLWEGLAATRVAAVGPIVADNLRRRGARVDICPEQGFVMKNLVQQIKRSLG